MTTLNIYKTACNIKNCVENNESLDNDVFNEFSNKYPKLYAMLQNKNMDNEMFEKLFDVMKKDSSENGALKFSEFGAEKYLYPQFGRPTEESMNNAKAKLNIFKK